MKQNDSKPTVMVTGASGYVASRIVKDLLDSGHTVHGTVRDASKKDKYKFLTDLAINSPGELKLFSANLLTEGSFGEAIKGCEVVMHTASPFTLSTKNPQENLVNPALKGTRNVLNSVNQAESVRRVILTSSVVSVYGNVSESVDKPGQTFTPEHWNETSSLSHQPYAYSKVLAEKEAWKIAKAQSRWDLTTVNPGFVLGPSLSSGSGSASLDFMKDLLSGKYKTGVPKLSFAVVDVRDVSKAHIAAMNPKAHGRHLTAHSKSVPMLELASAIEAKMPGKFKLPKSTLPTFFIYLFGPLQGFSWKFIRNNIGFSFGIDNQKLRNELKVEPRPWEQTLVDHAQQMIDDGLVK